MIFAVTPLYALPLAAIFLILWFRVTGPRANLKVSIGDGGDKNLLLRIRHHGNFVDCIRTRKRPICDVEIGHRSVSVCHLGNVCIRLGGGELLWNPKKEEFVGGEKKNEANALRTYRYRGGWTL